jgi:hypothetical protein
MNAVINDLTIYNYVFSSVMKQISVSKIKDFNPEIFVYTNPFFSENTHNRKLFIYPIICNRDIIRNRKRNFKEF